MYAFYERSHEVFLKNNIVPWGSLTTEPSVDIWEVKGQKRGDDIIQGKPCMHVTTVSKP